MNNSELLKLAEKYPPPQSYFEGPEEDLFMSEDLVVAVALENDSKYGVTQATTADFSYTAAYEEALRRLERYGILGPTTCSLTYEYDKDGNVVGLLVIANFVPDVHSHTESRDLVMLMGEATRALDKDGNIRGASVKFKYTSTADLAKIRGDFDAV